MFLGYNTNGFAHHRLDDAVEIIAEWGYGGVAITPDVHHLDPNANDFVIATKSLASRLRELRLKCVVESGARFILDPRHKHQPTLLSAHPARRLAYLGQCLQIATETGAECVSFWSGTAMDNTASTELMKRLVEHCKRLCDLAAMHNIRLAFEPEPGMFIDTMDKFAELHARVNHPQFGLTMDVGHLVCNGELPVSRHLVAWKDWLWNVHIEDMRVGVHDHVMFGEGEVDLADVFAGLRAANYQSGVYVELSRHSHDAVNIARKSIAFLREFIKVT